jgi:hypothetical protein
MKSTMGLVIAMAVVAPTVGCGDDYDSSAKPIEVPECTITTTTGTPEFHEVPCTFPDGSLRFVPLSEDEKATIGLVR